MSRSSSVVRCACIAIAALSASLVAPSIALADKDTPHDSGAAPKFPMAGKEFVQRIDARLKKMHDKLEERMKKNNPSDDVKKKARDAYTALATKAKALATKAAADGSVSLDEAKSVRKLFREAKKQAKKEARARRTGAKRARDRK